jgi:hypothetical protein
LLVALRHAKNKLQSNAANARDLPKRFRSAASIVN